MRLCLTCRWTMVFHLIGCLTVVGIGSSLPEVAGEEPGATDAGVSFSNDLAPVLSQHCVSCHGDGRPVRGDLNLTTFEGLTRGGDNGSLLGDGDASESLLVQKLRGTADGQRMPVNAPPLSDEVIALIETWVREGANYDGADAGLHVTELAAIAQAQKATHDELRADRKQLALKNWQLVLPGVDPQQHETANFFLLGNVSSRTLNDVAGVAEKLIPKVTRALRVPTSEPFLKGAVTLYVFQSRYDYGELSRMVEKRERMAGTDSHCRFTFVDAYIAFHASSASQEAWETLLAQQIAGVYLASCGRSPHWFRTGAARAVAVQLTPRSSQARDWNRDLNAAFRRLSAPDDFLTGRSTAEDVDSLAYGFGKFLLSDARRFRQLMGLLEEGATFAAAFQRAFGAGPDKVAVVWARRQAQELQRRR